MGFSTGYVTRYSYAHMLEMLEYPQNAIVRRGEIAPNTKIRKEGSEIIIRLWHTDILSMRADGTGQFLSNYNSVLTRGRLNSYLPNPGTPYGYCRVYQLHAKCSPFRNSSKHITMVRGQNGFFFPMMPGVEYGWDTSKCPDLEILMLGMRAGDRDASRVFAAFCRSQAWEKFAQCVEEIAGQPYGERPRCNARDWEKFQNEPGATVEVNGEVYSAGRWFANPLTGRLARPVTRADVVLWGVDAFANEARVNGQLWRIVDAATAKRVPGLKGLFASDACTALDSTRGVVTF